MIPRTWVSEEAGMISSRETIWASEKFASGTTALRIPCFSAASNIGSNPRMGRNNPSSESSPINIVSLRSSSGICWVALNIAILIGRSKPEPLFGSHAGESETVILVCGQRFPELLIADRIRSRASLSAASGNPRS